MYSDCETLPCCDFQNISQRQKHIRHAQIQNYTYFSRDLVSFIRVPVIVCRIAMPCCHRSASKNRQERIPQVALRAEMRTSQSQLAPLLATLQQKNQPNFSVSSFSCILSSQSNQFIQFSYLKLILARACYMSPFSPALCHLLFSSPAFSSLSVHNCIFYLLNCLRPSLR